MTHQTAPTHRPTVGERVFIQPSSRSPYAGRIGTIAGINDDDIYGAILVRFADGLQFRYTSSELVFLAPSPSHSPNHSREVA
jgi:hypothetical protein